LLDTGCWIQDPDVQVIPTDVVDGPGLRLSMSAGEGSGGFLLQAGTFNAVVDFGVDPVHGPAQTVRDVHRQWPGIFRCSAFSAIPTPGTQSGATCFRVWVCGCVSMQEK